MVGAAHAGWVESYAEGQMGSALIHAALDAIAPMVEKVIEDAKQAARQAEWDCAWEGYE